MQKESQQNENRKNWKTGKESPHADICYLTWPHAKHTSQKSLKLTYV